jgi:hypothetical protein
MSKYKWLNSGTRFANLGLARSYLQPLWRLNMKRTFLRHTLLGSVAALAVSGGAAMAAPVGGNILLTGHDNDFHCVNGNFGNPCGALGVESAYVRNGSALPVLVIDNGTELSSSLTGLGVPIVKVSVGSVTAGMFNNSLYSAFAVASDTDCGGCDNPFGTGTTLAAFGSSIASFYNAGGGILGLTSSDDPAGFAYVPDAAAGTPIGHASGFVATAAGIADIPGFFAVNGDETHNIFTTFSSAYSVAEVDSTDGNAAVTLFLSGGSIVCTTSCTVTGGPGTGVPEPASPLMLIPGLFGLLGFAMWRRARA